MFLTRSDVCRFYLAFNPRERSKHRTLGEAAFETLAFLSLLCYSGRTL